MCVLPLLMCIRQSLRVYEVWLLYMGFIYSHKCLCVCVCWVEGGAEGGLAWGTLSGPLINPLSGRRVSVIGLLQRSWLRPKSTTPESTTQEQAHAFVLLHLWGHSLIRMQSLALKV